MKVSDLLESRRENWRELEQLCGRIERAPRSGFDARMAARFASLYRSACADLALADAYQLPPRTTEYLNRIVGRAHNQLYRSRAFALRAWGRLLLEDVPQRLFTDNYLRLAFVVFWGVFLLSAVLAYQSPEFAQQIAGKQQIEMMEESFSQPIDGLNPETRSAMAGFYIWHNTGIGLRCFVFGLLFGIGGLYITVFNASMLGAVFGHMAATPHWDNFSHFVTAHGPFELTAIVLSAGAGMRLGFSLIHTQGRTRVDSLRQSARETMPIMGAVMILFFLAACIEAFLSPSSAPYAVKAGVAVLSTALMMGYFVGLGIPRGDAP